MTMHADARNDTFTSNSGRDAGKTFRICEVPPIEMAAFVMQLLAALRAESVEALTELLRGEQTDGPADIGPALRVLAGCDPQAVRALLTRALEFVQVAPDPASPGMFRALDPALDVREMGTLGELLTRFIKLNASF